MQKYAIGSCSHGTGGLSSSHISRATERIVGARGKYKKWGLYYRLCEGGSGGMPPGNVLQFYML